MLPVPVAARFTISVDGHSLAGIVGSNATGDMDVSLLSEVCCEVELSATG